MPLIWPKAESIECGSIAIASAKFLSSSGHENDTRVHFGLGAASKIDSLEIIWPSGKVEKLSNLAADKFYFLLEGQGSVSAEKIRPAKTPRS